MVSIKLSKSEMLQGALWGCMRNIENRMKGLQDKYGANSERNGWQISIVGSLGEIAVCKYFGIYYNAEMNNFKAKDVGGKYQVRTSPYDNSYLCLHKEDADDDIFIAVIGYADTFRLIGYIRAIEGKRSKYWCDKWNTGRPAYWVPQEDLKPIETILQEGDML